MTLVGLAPVCDRLFNSGPESVVFVDVDGEKTAGAVERFMRGGPCPYLAWVRISPGRHRVGILYTVSAGPEPEYRRVEIDAEPMATYDIRRLVQGYAVTFEAIRRRP